VVLIEALAWQGSACVIVDPKPSRALAEVVAGVGGTIWTIGGDRRWDALLADPSELASQLVEVLPVDARTKVYRDAARLWVLGRWPGAAAAARTPDSGPTSGAVPAGVGWRIC
jgi:hypothetical protein